MQLRQLGFPNPGKAKCRRRDAFLFRCAVPGGSPGDRQLPVSASRTRKNPRNCGETRIHWILFRVYPRESGEAGAAIPRYLAQEQGTACPGCRVHAPSLGSSIDDGGRKATNVPPVRNPGGLPAVPGNDSGLRRLTGRLRPQRAAPVDAEAPCRTRRSGAGRRRAEALPRTGPDPTRAAFRGSSRQGHPPRGAPAGRTLAGNAPGGCRPCRAPRRPKAAPPASPR